jgi:G:T-mismatch repair DNA endonuclease (very short patch repair protein)
MIDVSVQLKRRCVVFEVEDYLCFGTPNDLHTYEYWQSFFHKCSWHKYSVNRDPQANKNESITRDGDRVREAPVNL